MQKNSALVARLWSTSIRLEQDEKLKLDSSLCAQVARRTEGFRKLYCGAISASTSEKMLQAIFDKNIVWFVLTCHSQAYFAEFGEVRSTSVIRDKDTGLSKGFGFVSMQASEGAKKALLRQVLKDTISSFPSL